MAAFSDKFPTLRNVRDGLLLVYWPKTPEGKSLQMLLCGTPDASLRRRYREATASVEYDPTMMQTIRHYVRQHFGEWAPDTLTAVHDWIVAEHSRTAENAWNITMHDLLQFLKSKRPKIPQPIIPLGSRNYAVGDDVVVVEDSEDAVLKAFVSKATKNARWIGLDKQSLIQLSGYTEAPRILRRIRSKFLALASAIDCPGKKGQGGLKIYVQTMRKAHNK